MANCAEAMTGEHKDERGEPGEEDYESRVRSAILSVSNEMKTARSVLPELAAYAHPDQKRAAELKRLCIGLRKRYQSTLIAMENFKNTVSTAEKKAVERQNDPTHDNQESSNVRSHGRQLSLQRIKEEEPLQGPTEEEQLSIQEITEDLQEMNSRVEEAKQHCCIIKDVLVTALREVGMAELSQIEKDLQSNIGDQIEKFAGGIVDTMEEVGGVFVFLVEQLAAQSDIGQKLASSGAQQEREDQFIDEGDKSDRNRVFSALTQGLKGVVSQAIADCATIRDSTKEILKETVKDDTRSSDKPTEVILHNCSEIQNALNEVREELNAAEALVIEKKDEIRERKNQRAAADQRMEKMKRTLKQYIQKAGENEMERINIQKELQKTKALLSRRASQLLNMEQALGLEQEKNRILAPGGTMERLDMSASDVIQAEREIISLREQLVGMSQRMEDNNQQARMIQADHEAEMQKLKTMHSNKIQALELAYEDLADRMNREASDKRVELYRANDTRSRLQEMVKEQQMEVNKKEDVLVHQEVELSVMKQSSLELSTEKEKLKDHLELAELQIEQLRDKISKQEQHKSQELEALNKRIENMTVEHIDEMQQLNRTLSEDANNLKDVAQQVEVEKAKLAIELAKTKDKLEEQNSKEASQSAKLEETEKELQAVLAKLREDQSTLAHTQNQFEESQKQLQVARTTIESKEIEVMKLAENLVSTEKTFNDLKESKLRLLTQSALEIERLKSVIRRYVKPEDTDQVSSAQNRAPALLSFTGWV